MKIGILGATGMAGSDLYKEAVKRGHDVTALVRNKTKAIEMLGKDVKVNDKCAFCYEKTELMDFDVIINAFATEPKKAYLHVDLAARLVHLFREDAKPRLVFILGAGSLKTGSDDHLLVEDLKKIPDAASWIDIPVNALKELNFLREVDNVNWVGVSPSASFIKGENKGFVVGKDHLLVDSKGNSQVTSGAMAAAILDEVENPKHIKTRFTVCDK
ncbi:MAG: NAD(P)-dependent oxidoreductase [Campylobacteraceae bacterium]